MSTININVKTSSDGKFVIAIEPTKTTEDLKKAIAEKTQVPVERQRLIYSGRVLKDQDTLETYKVADGNTVHMVKGSQPKTADASITNTAPSQVTPNPPSTTPSAGSLFGQPPISPSAAANPFAAFAGLGATPSANANPPVANPLNMFGTGFGAGAMGNSFGAMDPNMMNQMLQNPMFAQYMSSVLQNPSVLDSIIATNPQLANMGPEVRGMMQSPEFRQMVSNPDMIRQMATMANAFQGQVPANPFAAFGNFPPVDPQVQQQMASLFMGGMGGMGGMGATANPPAVPDARSPEERFQVQLQQLSDMGFWDAAKNIRVLQATGGDVNAATDMLLSNPNL
ncbi:hypothetical protein BDF14DRAFT_1875384 [Spinellus fusiger]|nr:hypothetical protein BDF14DRAFT_1875384 [Spinellus fusiger]